MHDDEQGWKAPGRAACRAAGGSGLTLLAVLATAVLLPACTQEPGGETPATEQAPQTQSASAEATPAMLAEAFNTGELARLDALVAEDVVRHGPPASLISLPGMPQGRELIKQEWRDLKAVFPDARMSVDTVVAGGDRVAAHYTVAGTQQGPYYGVAPSGAPASLRLAEFYRLEADRIAEIWTVADPLSTLQFLTLPAPAPAPLEALPAEVFASFRPGRFLESVAVDAEGSLYVSAMFDGEILKIGADGTVAPFVKIPFGPPQGFLRGVVCLVFDAEGGLNVNVSSSDPSIHGVWRVDRDGRALRRAALPPQASPNGIAIDREGNLYIADSVNATIWRVHAGDDRAEAWLVNPLVGPRPYLAMFPGANGIKVFDQAVYTVVSDTGRFVKIPIQSDGGPGLPVVVAEQFPGDDFAFDSAGNVYMTTHPFNTVIRLSPSGQRSVVAGVEQGVVGPTSVAFGTAKGDETTLYVLNDGGLARPLPNSDLSPNVVKLETGVAGAPIGR